MTNDALGPCSSIVGMAGLAVMMAYTVDPLDVYLEKNGDHSGYIVLFSNWLNPDYFICPSRHSKQRQRSLELGRSFVNDRMEKICNPFEMHLCLHCLPHGYGWVLGLDPPGLGCVDGLPVDLHPGSQTPESLLENGGDHPISSGADVQKVVTSQRHGADKILQRDQGKDWLVDWGWLVMESTEIYKSD